MSRYTKRFAVALLSVVGCLALLYSLRGIFLEPYLKKTIAANIQSYLGVTVSVGRIKGNYLTSLVVEDVSTQREGKETLTLLKLKKAKASYSLWNLLSSYEAFLDGLSIEAEGLRADLDLRQKARAEEGQAEGFPPEIAAGPVLLPRLIVRDSSLFLRFEDADAEFARIFIEIEPSNHGQPIQGHINIGEARLVATGGQVWSSPLSTSFAIGPNNLTIKNMKLADTEVVSGAAVSFRQPSPGVLSFESDWNILGGRLNLTGILSEKSSEFRLHAETINLEKIAKIAEPFAVPATGNLAAEAALSFYAERPERPEGKVALTLENGSLAGVSVEKASLDAELSAEQIFVHSLSGDLGANRFSLSETTLPAKAVFQGDIYGILQGASGSFTVRVSDLPSLLDMAGIVNPTLEKHPVNHLLTMAGDIRQGRVKISEGKLIIEGGVINLKQANMVFPARGEEWLAMPIEAEMTAKVPDLTAVSSLFGLPPLKGDVEADIDIHGTISKPAGKILAKGEGLQYRGMPFGTLEASARASGGIIKIDSLVLSHKGDHASLTGTIETGTWEMSDVLVKASVEDIAVYRTLVPGEFLSRGSVEASLAASGPVAGPDLRLDLTARHGNTWGLPFNRLVLKGHKTGQRVEDIRLDLGFSEYFLSAAGALTYDIDQSFVDLQLDDLAIRRDQHFLKLAEPVTLQFKSTTGYTVSRVKLRGNVGQLALDGTIAPDNEVNATITASGFSGEGWLDLLNDRLVMRGADAVFKVSGKLESPVIGATGTVAHLGDPDLPFPLSGAFDLQYSAAGLSLKRFEWRAEDGHRLMISGTLPLDPFARHVFLTGTIDLAATIDAPNLKTFSPLMPEELSATGMAHGELRLSGTWDRPSGHVIVKADNVILGGDIEPLPPGPFEADVDIAFSEDMITLNSVDVSSPQLNLTSQGQWTDAPSLQVLLRGQRETFTGYISVQAALDVADISWMAEGIEELRKAAGRLSADISIEGKAANPEVSGNFSLANGELRGDATLPQIKNLFIEAKADTRHIKFQDFHGYIGGAPFRASGTVEREDDGARVDIQVQGENLLFYRDEGMRVRADADLKAHGPISRLDITGDIMLTDGRFTENYNFLNILRGSDRPGAGSGVEWFSFHEYPLKNAQLKIRLGTKNPFIIRNNIAKGDVRPDLLLTGTGEIPVVTGRIYIDPSRIDLPAGKLHVESGIISFPESKPDRPTLDIIGRTKMKGYDITVVVEGSYQEPVVTLTSTPPLPEDQLLLLLLTGTVPAEGFTPATAQKKGMTVALYVGQEILESWFGGEFTENGSLLDRFEVEIGRDVTKKGDETIDAQFRLKKDLVREGDTLYVTTEKDIYDEFNLGLKFVIRFK